MRRVCPSCGEDALFVSEAVYDGFRKTGEIHRCTACGQTLAPQAAAPPPAKKKVDPLWAAFAAEDTPDTPSLFDVEAETSRLCRKCRHYVVHPFTQRCMLHDKEVAATDSCDQFEVKRES